MSTRILRRCLAPAVLCLALNGCMFHHHRIGTGPTGTGSTSARQYYLGFGLMRLNEIDSQRFTEDAVSYDISSEFTLTDFLFTTFLWPLTVVTRTVTVDR